MTDGPVSLYSTRAHVFQINPETKNSWDPKGVSAIPISFIFAGTPNRRELTIVGVNENGQTVLNCPILPKTVINKRSQKFCQWHDLHGMTYGLGFNSEVELDEFMDAFRQLQQDISASPALDSSPAAHAPTIAQQSLMQQNMIANQTMERTVSAGSGGWINKAQSQFQSDNSSLSEMNGRDQGSKLGAGDIGMASAHQTNVAGHLGQQQHPAVRRQQVSQEPQNEHDTNNNLNNNGLNNGNRYPRSQSMSFGVQQQQQQHQKPSSGVGSGESPDSEIMNQNESEEQLKYESERLKQALEESSKNALIWQNELMNLRTNNAKLTQALQESKAHVEEWEKELLGLRNENKELKLRLMALESAKDSDRSEDNKQNMQDYKNFIEELQTELRKKDSELDQMQRSMEQLEIKAHETQNGRVDDATSSEVVISSYQKQRLDSLTCKLGAKITELEDIRKEFEQFSNKLYH